MLNGSRRASLKWGSQGLDKGSAESAGAGQPMLIVHSALCLFQVRGLQAQSLILMRSTPRWGQLVIQSEQWENKSAQELTAAHIGGSGSETQVASK